MFASCTFAQAIYEAVTANDAVFAQLLVMLYNEPDVKVVPPPPPAEFKA